MTKSVIGDSPKRREDQRFVTGQGAYLDDLRFERLAHAVVLRSPHAHARIRSIDVSAAKKAPGVLAVLTAADAAADGLKPLRPYAEANVQTGEPFIFDDAAAAGRRQGALRRRDRWRWSWPRRWPRRSTPPSWSRSTTSPCPPSRWPMPPRAPGAPQLSTGSAGQCLHRLADRRCRGRRCRLRQGRAHRHARARQPPHRHQPDGAARLGRAVRSGERPLHAPRLEPEHPHQPQPRRPRARRRAARTCASSRPMSAAASAPRISPMPSTC